MRRPLTCLLAISLACVGCATPAGRTGSDAGQAAHEPTAGARPPVTLTSAHQQPLGSLARVLADEVGGGLVVMKGLEDLPVPPLQHANTPFVGFVSQMATALRLNVQETPSYLFLYPEGYEALTNVSFEGLLDPAYDGVSAALAFGFDTPVFEAFALLGDALGITLVSDNIIGDALCGSMNVAEGPLHHGLDAVLKSARVPQDQIVVESTPDYIFVRAVQNTTRSSTIIGGDVLSEAENKVLDTRVSVVVPPLTRGEGQLMIPRGATPLGSVLGSLSEQLGVPVAVSTGLEALPVNPTILNNVTVRTAMDLLIRQWPVPEFGYELKDGRIRIRSVQGTQP